MNKNLDLTCGLGSNSVEHCLDHVINLKRNIMLIFQPMNTIPTSCPSHAASYGILLG